MARNNSVLYYFIYLSIGVIYPAYCSLIALQTKDKKDDTVWLIYWIVFASFNVVEVVTDALLFWFPFNSILKLIFLAWCTAPIGQNGAFYVYKLFLEPFFHLYGGQISYLFTQVVEMGKTTYQYLPAYPK